MATWSLSGCRREDIRVGLKDISSLAEPNQEQRKGGEGKRTDMRKRRGGGEGLKRGNNNHVKGFEQDLDPH